MAGSKKEIKEVQNYHEALDYVERLIEDAKPNLLLLLGGQRLARFVPSETAIMQNRDRYYVAIRQSRSLGSLHPILEFLAECFAISAEAVIEGTLVLCNRFSMPTHNP